MTAGVVQEQNVEKQLGCMAGFFNIFDRHQNFTGKRNYATKRLPPAPVDESTTPPAKSSPATPRESEKQQPSGSATSSDPLTDSAAPGPTTPTRSPLPLPVFDLKDGSRSKWKFSKEVPRLSLDSRAVFDAKGSLKPREIRTNPAILAGNCCENDDDAEEKQRRSPSVIARLMGLERLPSSDSEPAQKAELRRSASESRVNKDQYTFIDGFNLHSQQSCQSRQLHQQNLPSHIATNAIRDSKNNELKVSNGFREDRGLSARRVSEPREFVVRSSRAEPARAPQHRGMVQRKNFFDSADFFPELKHSSVSVHGDIDMRIKRRGIDEPCKDLETLKQILEALQLKGLLHPTRPQSQSSGRNFVYERSLRSHDEAPIIVMKPARSPVHSNRSSRIRKDASHSGFTSRNGTRRIAREPSPAVSPGRDRPVVGRSGQSQTRERNSTSQTRNECGIRSPNRRSSAAETQRRLNEPVEDRKATPVQSPRTGSRGTRSVQISYRSPRSQKQTTEVYRGEKVFVPAEDELSTISDSSIGSQLYSEALKMEEYKEGRSLLERCGKLLNSIAEITATPSTSELQPSPVSVLDSSFYKESSPSPVLKRSLDFKDQLMESEDEMYSSAMSSTESKSDEKFDDCDFIYISDILRASNYLTEDSDVFLLLERERYLKGKDASKESRLERRLIFDTIKELLDRKRLLPPWKAVSCPGHFSLRQIWSEFRKIKERTDCDDLFEAICGVLKKDLAEDSVNGWGDCHIEVSEAVLDIERLIYKDLIGETIRDMAAFAGSCDSPTPLSRRKLAF